MNSNTLPPRSLMDGSLDGQPEHMLFRHSGHRTAVVNFAWNNFVKDGLHTFFDSITPIDRATMHFLAHS
jgi:hypothetical protein